MLQATSHKNHLTNITKSKKMNTENATSVAKVNIGEVAGGSLVMEVEVVGDEIWGEDTKDRVLWGKLMEELSNI